MKKLIFITALLLILPRLVHSQQSEAEILQSMTDVQLLFVKDINSQLISTQSQLETALIRIVELSELYNFSVGVSNMQTYELSLAIEQRDTIIASQQATIRQLEALIEHRHQFGDFGLSLQLGAGTGVFGQVQGQVWLNSDLFLFLNGGAQYPYLWDREAFSLQAAGGIGYGIERR